MVVIGTRNKRWDSYLSVGCGRLAGERNGRLPQIESSVLAGRNRMGTSSVSRDFDTLASVYDETRQPLDPETIQGLFGFLVEHRWHSLLEVGVGTGRVARPLVDLGVHLVGVDASRGMLGRAAAKGVPYLLRGNAFRLPFADRTFDAALFVHVLHILDRPEEGIREAARVSRDGVLAVVDLPPEGDGSLSPAEEEPRRILRQILADAGFSDLVRRGPRAREQEILRAFPPTTVRMLSDREVTEPLAKRLELLEKRAYRHVLRVPPDVLSKAVTAARAQVGDRTVTYRRTEAVVWWAVAPEVSAPSPSSPARGPITPRNDAP
jgi:ubiquinone/menaquinone biosynthesis C-methylase UbiE